MVHGDFERASARLKCRSFTSSPARNDQTVDPIIVEKEEQSPARVCATLGPLGLQLPVRSIVVGKTPEDRSILAKKQLRRDTMTARPSV